MIHSSLTNNNNPLRDTPFRLDLSFYFQKICPHPLLYDVEGLHGGRGVVVVLLGHGRLHAVPDDVAVGRLLEEDQRPHGNLPDEDDDQEDEELEVEPIF